MHVQLSVDFLSALGSHLTPRAGAQFINWADTANARPSERVELPANMLLRGLCVQLGPQYSKRQTEVISDMCPSRTISVRSSSSVSPVTYIICAFLLLRSRSWISIRYHRLSSGQNNSALQPLRLSLMSAYVSSLPGACGSNIMFTVMHVTMHPTVMHVTMHPRQP